MVVMVGGYFGLTSASFTEAVNAVLLMKFHLYSFFIAASAFATICLAALPLRNRFKYFHTPLDISKRLDKAFTERAAIELHTETGLAERTNRKVIKAFMKTLKFVTVRISAIFRGKTIDSDGTIVKSSTSDVVTTIEATTEATTAINEGTVEEFKEIENVELKEIEEKQSKLKRVVDFLNMNAHWNRYTDNKSAKKLMKEKRLQYFQTHIEALDAIDAIVKTSDNKIEAMNQLNRFLEEVGNRVLKLELHSTMDVNLLNSMHHNPIERGSSLGERPSDMKLRLSRASAPASNPHLQATIPYIGSPSKPLHQGPHQEIPKHPI